MKTWINKETLDKPSDEFKDAYVFSLNRKGYSTIFSNITDTWLRTGNLSITPIYEDLFVIGISIFAMDKRISRRQFKDCWTREINASIPVVEIEKWKKTENEWNKMLGFLTGDLWKISFRKSEHQYSLRERQSSKKIVIKDCDSVCLFSGGLDSFCGAISLLEQGFSPCLFGHNEYPKLKAKQEKLESLFNHDYGGQTTKFLSFTANSRAPINSEGKLKGTENTSRGRSLLFLCGALTIANILGDEVPVYIPENGFIGLNVPLTTSRKGTCSTRTTHPTFLNEFRNILSMVEINNPILNFFQYSTKREVVNSVKDTNAFMEGFSETISCSHPAVARYNKKGSRDYPINCGYCYPCLIRKSSLLDVNSSSEKYTYKGVSHTLVQSLSESEKSNDLFAVINSIYRYTQIDDSEIRRLVQCTGKLSEEEIEQYVLVYKKSMDDLIDLFSKDIKMKDYLDL